MRWVAAAAALSLPLMSRAEPPTDPAPNEESVVGPLPQRAQPPSSEQKGLGAPSSHAGIKKGGNTPGQATPAASQPWIGRTALSLTGVLGLALVAAGAIRLLAKTQGGLRGALGAGGRSPAGLLEILGRYPVGRGSTLVLLKLDRRVLLLSQNAGGRLGAGAGFATLCQITDPEEVASILVKSRDAEGDSMSERFRSMLGRADRTMAAAETEGPGRRVSPGESGDRAELWDGGRNQIPVVDVTRQPGPPDPSAAGTLRRRLASMRWTGLDGGARA
jgi:hypothetical protein